MLPKTRLPKTGKFRPNARKFLDMPSQVDLGEEVLPPITTPTLNQTPQPAHLRLSAPLPASLTAKPPTPFRHRAKPLAHNTYLVNQRAMPRHAIACHGRAIPTHIMPQEITDATAGATPAAALALLPTQAALGRMRRGRGAIRGCQSNEPSS
ncbi:uncharacterized protein BKA78DRAFT_123326 [Phyllosticta capitalensis]|uniref:uncharacterized protein n=1 Tax=Phyllosticta capitalensis TaxID=121624 RepID=UPI0031328D7F